MELARATAEDIARAVGAGDVTHTEVVGHALATIAEDNARLNAIVWVRDEAALRDAREAEEQRRRRPLEGVPFTAKDLTAIADGPSQQGSRAFAAHKPGVDAEVVRRLKDAGAILVGMTASPEFGAKPTTESALHGETRNPWDPTHTTGGSSGGAAVSAALGFAPLNQGSDAGGSVRIPAAACGVFGLKTTRGRISFAPMQSEAWGGLDTYGALTRTVRDNALFLDAAAGPATGDAYWAQPPERSFLSATEEQHTLRVAVAFERDGIAVDPEVRAAVRATADVLASLGHDVEEAQPSLTALDEPFLIVSTVGIGSEEVPEDKLHLLESRTKLIFDVARAMPASLYVRAQRAMHAASRDVASFFERYDVLLTPTLTRPAPPIGYLGTDDARAWEDYRSWICWTFPWNCTGQPAASVPAGMSSGGLPIGVQIVGPAAAERTVLSVASQLEAAQPWAHREPPRRASG